MSAAIVTVRGEAQLEGPPDLATFSATVHAAAGTAEEVQRRLAAAAALVQELVRDLGDALDRSSTTGLHVAPVFRPRTPDKISGYAGSYTASLVVADFDRLSDLVVRLGRIPDSQVDGPWWSLRRDNPLHRQARLEAIADARRRAEDYAAAFGATVGDLIEVSDLEGGWIGQAREMRSFAMAKDASDGPAFDFEPALQTVTGQVTVRFELRAGAAGS